MNPRARRIRKHNRKIYKCEVPALSKNIFRAVSAPYPEWYNKYYQSISFNVSDSWVNRLVHLGFDITTSVHDKEILINEKESLIIKVMYSIGLAELPTERIPTLYVHNIKSFPDRSFDIVVQKVADISLAARSKAHYQINESDDMRTKYGHDTHVHNVGMYNNKPVVFDW